MTMSPIPAATGSELIARHGITQVRYTRLADAEAQARRTAAAGER